MSSRYRQGLKSICFYLLSCQSPCESCGQQSLCLKVCHLGQPAKWGGKSPPLPLLPAACERWSLGALCLSEVDFGDSPGFSWSAEFLCFGCWLEEAVRGLPRSSPVTAWRGSGTRVALAVRRCFGLFFFFF